MENKTIRENFPHLYRIAMASIPEEKNKVLKTEASFEAVAELSEGNEFNLFPRQMDGWPVGETSAK